MDFKIKEVCHHLRISRKSYYELCREGFFPNRYRMGRSIRIPEADIQDLKTHNKAS